MILHQYPLHRISYCADDKSDKKMFTFIAKAATTNDHFCYVFSCSDKSVSQLVKSEERMTDMHACTQTHTLSNLVLCAQSTSIVISG